MRDYLRALGGEDLPAQIVLSGRPYRLQRAYKHNSVSAVGLYQADADRVVLKCYRSAGALFVPLEWVGRMMAAHEVAVLRRVQDVPGVPRLRGRYGRTGLVRDYVPGTPLTRRSRVNGQFFSRLMGTLRELHRRGIAYVDLEKAENILVGEDGRPYLIDFQVAYNMPERRLGATLPFRWVRRRLQEADLYHARKHLRRIMKRELSPEEVAGLRGRPWLVRLSNLANTPYKKLRRRLMGRD
jgi:hypothetical protein